MNQNDYHVNITLIILTASHEAEPQSFTADINLIEALLAKALLYKPYNILYHRYHDICSPIPYNYKCFAV